LWCEEHTGEHAETGQPSTHGVGRRHDSHVSSPIRDHDERGGKKAVDYNADDEPA
jgi:hypothetical protein